MYEILHLLKKCTLPDVSNSMHIIAMTICPVVSKHSTTWCATCTSYTDVGVVLGDQPHPRASCLLRLPRPVGQVVSPSDRDRPPPAPASEPDSDSDLDMEPKPGPSR